MNLSTKLFPDLLVPDVRSLRLLVQDPDDLYGFRILGQPTRTHRTHYYPDYGRALPRGKGFSLSNFELNSISASKTSLIFTRGQIKVGSQEPLAF